MVTTPTNPPNPPAAPKIWKDPAEADLFRPQLLQLLRTRAWKRSNPLYKQFRDGMEAQQDENDRAFKLLERGRHSAGQALLRKVQLAEGELKNLKIRNEIALLDQLDAQGIEREYKNNDPQDPTLQALFHFHLAGGKLHTIKLTTVELDEIETT